MGITMGLATPHIGCSFYTTFRINSLDYQTIFKCTYSSTLLTHHAKKLMKIGNLLKPKGALLIKGNEALMMLGRKRGIQKKTNKNSENLFLFTV